MRVQLHRFCARRESPPSLVGGGAAPVGGLGGSAGEVEEVGHGGGYRGGNLGVCGGGADPTQRRQAAEAEGGSEHV